MNPIAQRIAAMQALMLEQGISAYIIPATDPHISEYLPAHWCTLLWASGFTGSAGTLVLTQDFAGLWTDSRYFLQAEQQLAGSGIELMKLRIQHTPEFIEWLAERLPEGAVVGLDGNLLARSWYKMMESGLAPRGIRLHPKLDLVSPLWRDRPRLPEDAVYELPLKFAGTSRIEKLSQVRQRLAEHRADFLILSSLDDIAWLFNLRGTDVPYNPVFVSHAVVGREAAALFVHVHKLPKTLRRKLQREGIQVFDYQHVENYLSKIPASATVWFDPRRVSQHLPGALQQGVKIIESISPTTWLKACKSQAELAHIRATMVKDGVVLTKFFYWLAQNVGRQRIDELSATAYLHELRRQQKHCIGESFGTIAAYRDHAALPHYSATEESNAEILPTGIFLLDSGGQYLGGTTDTTRVISLGNPLDEEKQDYTLVLKGLIAVSTLRFPAGTRGWQFDAIARYPQWMRGINYGHGTGHGVGYFLNVHEGPQAISFTGNATSSQDAPMLPGMVTSVEPGIYRPKKHGIRLENLVLCRQDVSTEFGDWLSFETLTIAPIFTQLIDTSLMTKDEISWLRQYNKRVYAQLNRWLTTGEKAWLKQVTAI